MSSAEITDVVQLSKHCSASSSAHQIQPRSSGSTSSFVCPSQLKASPTSENCSLTVIGCQSQGQFHHSSGQYLSGQTAFYSAPLGHSSSPNHSTQVILQNQLLHSNDSLPVTVAQTSHVQHNNSPTQVPVYTTKIQTYPSVSTAVQPFSLMSRTRPLLCSQTIDSAACLSALDNRRKTFRARASLVKHLSCFYLYFLNF